MHAPVIFAFKAGSGVTAVAVTAGERIAAKHNSKYMLYTAFHKNVAVNLCQ